MKGKAPFREDDLRFKRHEKEPKPQMLAVVFFVMDQSGSMNQERIMIARAVCQYFLRWLKKKREYKDVVTIFIKQEAESEEVSEEKFFTRTGNGGTKISTAWELILEFIKKRYPSERYNSYVIHFTDGENEGSDNVHVVEIMPVLLGKVNLFGYFQYRGPEQGNMRPFLENIQKQHANLKLLFVEDTKGIKPALEEFLREE